jgi:7SK snRNA methylphosphate capping enzyme
MLDQQHGNYKAYYRKRSYDTLERVSCFKREWFTGKKCIDIGCNEGAVTLQLAESYGPDSIVGIDLDARMIDAANAALKRATLEALKARVDQSSSSNNSSLTTLASTSRKINHFLPRSIALTKTTLFAPSTNTPSRDVPTSIPNSIFSSQYPGNVSFVKKNVIDFVSATAKFDLVSCLSVTKWIHLTEGDSGLLTLFQIIYNLTLPGGRAIIEYQPWSSYLNNRKTSPTTLRMFDTIKLRPEDFETILTRDIGFVIEMRLGTPLSEAKGFKRPILILVKETNAAMQWNSISRATIPSSSAAPMEVEDDSEPVSEVSSDAAQMLLSGKMFPTQLMGRKRYFGEMDDEEAEEMLDGCNNNSDSDDPDGLPIYPTKKKSNYHDQQKIIC